MRSPHRLVRGVVFTLLAFMLVLRVGPICEAGAAAAAPSASPMVACDGAGRAVPVGKAPAATCSMPCAVVLEADRTAGLPPVPFASNPSWPAGHADLAGLVAAPATPPPRAA